MAAAVAHRGCSHNEWGRPGVVTTAVTDTRQHSTDRCGHRSRSPSPEPGSSRPIPRTGPQTRSTGSIPNTIWAIPPDNNPRDGSFTTTTTPGPRANAGEVSPGSSWFWCHRGASGPPECDGTQRRSEEAALGDSVIHRTRPRDSHWAALWAALWAASRDNPVDYPSRPVPRCRAQGRLGYQSEFGPASIPLRAGLIHCRTVSSSRHAGRTHVP